MECVKLAPASTDKKSAVEDEAVMLSEPHLDPALAPPGSTVNLSVKVRLPKDPQPSVRVFAREDKKKQVFELQPQKDGVYSSGLLIDPKTPLGETTISVVAMRAEPIDVKLPKAQYDPLTEFVRRLDDLDPDKPYVYDPRILASENRLDIKFTVLDPKAATPPAAPASPPAAATDSAAGKGK